MRLLIFVILFFISGCESLGVITDKAAKINDDALKGAEFTICQGASIGSIKRRFNTPELSELWRNICEEKQGFNP